jgi:hypothetical protein
MGNVIKRGSSTKDILRDVIKTLANATSRGSPYQQEAERFLGQVAARATDLSARVAATTDALTKLRSEQGTVLVRCDDLVRKIRDDLFNQIGRAAHDPVYLQIYPQGSSGYIDRSPPRKPSALLLNAQQIEAADHPLIPAAVATDAADLLRAAAKAVQEINEKLAAARAEADLWAAQTTANGRRGQLQLARLKKYWLATGLTEPAVHELIPDRGYSPVSATDAPTEPDSEVEVVPEDLIDAAAK